MGAVQIFDYQDYRAFLADFYKETKRARPQFSYRSFALKAKLNSPNYLKLVIDGKRRITEGQIPKFVKGLGLIQYEASYFVSLVNLDNTPSTEMKSFYSGQLAHFKKVSQTKSEVLDENIQEKLSRWETWFLREFFQIPGATTNEEEIKRQLYFDTDVETIKESLKLLTDLGLLKKSAQGLRPAQPLLIMGDKIKSDALKSLHRAYLDLAKLSIDRVPKESRRLAGLTLALRSEDFEKISKQLLTYISELNKSYSNNEAPQEIYHLQLALFPLTKNRRNFL